MGIVVRATDLGADRALLIQVLRRYLTPLSDERRFDWLYRQSPHGHARAWLAVDENNGETVGAAALFPRRMHAKGIEIAGCVLGDFCMHPSYRSLGPALQLQRACLMELESGAWELGYDFPSAGMAAVYRRLGVEPREQIVRWAKPLRVDRRIAQRIRMRLLARGLSAVGNHLLELQDSKLVRRMQWTISLHEGACQEEFSVLAREVSAGYGLCVERTAKYLNWRYLAHPIRHHQILTARQNGSLSGYLVFTQSGLDARIVELFGIPQEEMLKSLVAGAAKLLRERGVMTLSAPMGVSHPWVPLLRSLGFRPRESTPVILLRTARFRAAAEAIPGRGWLLMDGDRDS